MWQVDKVAMEIAFPNGFQFTSNDVPGKHHRKTSSLRAPRISSKVLLASRNLTHTWYEAATAEADINLDIYSALDGWRKQASAQAAFVSIQDSLTGRVNFLYHPEPDAVRSLKASGMSPLIYNLLTIYPNI